MSAHNPPGDARERLFHPALHHRHRPQYFGWPLKRIASGLHIALMGLLGFILPILLLQDLRILIGHGSSDPTPIVLQLLICVWVAGHLSTCVARGRRPLRFFFWCYVYVWLGLAPLLQVPAQRFPLTIIATDKTRIGLTQALVFIGLLAFEIGSRLPTEQIVHRNLSIRSSRWQLLSAFVDTGDTVPAARRGWFTGTAHKSAGRDERTNGGGLLHQREQSSGCADDRRPDSPPVRPCLSLGAGPPLRRPRSRPLLGSAGTARDCYESRFEQPHFRLAVLARCGLASSPDHPDGRQDRTVGLGIITLRDWTTPLRAPFGAVTSHSRPPWSHSCPSTR